MILNEMNIRIAISMSHLSTSFLMWNRLSMELLKVEAATSNYQGRGGGFPIILFSINNFSP